MGRVAGSVNKNKTEFHKVLTRYMDSKGVDPHFYLVDLIADNTTRQVVIGEGKSAAIVEMPTVAIEYKLQAAKELAQYLQPKLRAMLLSGDEEAPLRFSITTVRYGDTQNTDTPPA